MEILCNDYIMRAKRFVTEYHYCYISTQLEIHHKYRMSDIYNAHTTSQLKLVIEHIFEVLEGTIVDPKRLSAGWYKYNKISKLKRDRNELKNIQERKNSST